MITHSHPLTTITFLRFNTAAHRWWALRQMRTAHASLASVPGLLFYKLLGSGGGNGFSVIPDLSTYAFLAVWKDKAVAERFLKDHSFSNQALIRAQHHWTIFLETTQVKGKWEGAQPFPVNKTVVCDGPMAVLTRATIHPQKLLSFWRHVPAVSSRLAHYRAGLLFSKGIGEIPLLQQATFSLWANRDAMIAYAYRGAKHQEMIRKTKVLGWYKEELFAEFVPTGSWGHWPDVTALSFSTENKVNLST